eukprot:TRINITY_DN30129_c0_g1_i2.p2 TRINITY_DN30129_c0_g1~~TRINITY_DN30129_c0_g1_i2.p2  ORF type:complete len:113 (-),score=24.93 TRINITY_DN30129_c0_g1_i2:283-621(-)
MCIWIGSCKHRARTKSTKYTFKTEDQQLDMLLKVVPPFKGGNLPILGVHLKMRRIKWVINAQGSVVTKVTVKSSFEMMITNYANTFSEMSSKDSRKAVSKLNRPLKGLREVA